MEIFRRNEDSGQALTLYDVHGILGSGAEFVTMP